MTRLEEIAQAKRLYSNFKYLAHENDMTMKAVYEKADVRQGLIYDCLRRNTLPMRRDIERIAKCLGSTADEMTGTLLFK